MSESREIVPNPPTSETAAVEAKKAEHYVVGDFLVAERPQAVSLAPLTEEQQEVMQRVEEDTRVGAKWPLIQSGGVLANASTYLALGVPFWVGAVGAAVAMGGGAVIVAKVQGAPMRNRRLRGKQELAVATALGSAEALTFTKNQLGVNVGRDVLNQTVLFQSERGMKGLSAQTLLDGVGAHAPGIVTRESQQADRIDADIYPAALVKQGLLMVGEDRRERFLNDASASLALVSEASQALPPPGLVGTTPESMRPMFEDSATRLLLGTLGVLGTLRAHVGPMLADKLNDFYVTHTRTDKPEYAGITTSAARLSEPTMQNVPWEELDAFRMQLG